MTYLSVQLVERGDGEDGVHGAEHAHGAEKYEGGAPGEGPARRPW